MDISDQMDLPPSVDMLAFGFTHSDYHQQVPYVNATWLNEYLVQLKIK